MLYLVYINKLPKFSNDNSKIVIFTEDTSIIITNPELTDFKNNVIKISQDINSQFSTEY
jgi:hypothetical protein